MKTMQSLKDSFLAVLVLCAAGASAAPIDVWEPVKAGPNNLIPSASALRSTGLPTKWIGYSNGDIYWNGTQVNFSDIYSHDTLRGGVPTAIAAGGTWDDDWAVVSYTKYIGDPRNALYQIFVTHNGPSMMAFVPQGVAGEVLGVSANPANSDLLYLATTSGGYAGSRITKMFEHRSASDPLNVPSGQAISAAAQSASVDVAVVGTENGEVWSVSGIKAGHPTWTRIDRVGGVVVMPQVVVTKIDIDSRDFSGKTFTVSFNDYSHPSWITRNGGQTWTEFALSWLPGVNLARIRNVSSAQVSGATTFYGWVYGMHGFPWAVRSDDNGVNWFITSRWSGFNLVVEYKHYDRGLVVNQMMPLFRVRNLGSVNLPLAQTKLEYMLTPEGTSPMVWSCDWTPYGCQDVRATFGTYNVYLSLPNNAVVQPGAVSGQIQGRINKLDWSNMDQSNDYSYMANATDWTVNPRMTFWNADLRVWGGY